MVLIDINFPILYVSIDIWTEILFISSFICWMVSYVDIQKNDDEFAERKTWNALDPTLIGEAVFAVGCIFAMARLLCVFQLSPNLGPLLVLRIFD